MKLFNSSTAAYAFYYAATAPAYYAAFAATAYAAYAAANHATYAEERLPLYGSLYKTMLSLCINTRKVL